MTRREEIARALSEGYPARISDGFLVVENPDFEEDNGTDPFLVAPLALPAQEPRELVKRLRTYQQAYPEAVIIEISRQVCDEAASALMDQAAEIDALRKDSAGAWDKCEERRLQAEKAEAELKASLAERDKLAQAALSEHIRADDYKRKLDAAVKALEPFAAESYSSGPQHEFVTVRRECCDVAAALTEGK